MAYNEEVHQYASEQLSEFKEFTCKKMFGAMSYMRDGKAFACVVDDKFYLKVDETNLEEYTSRGMDQFNPRNTAKGMPYWTVPKEVSDDKKELKKWATKSWKIATKK
jgi:TfoX/Sxy family transcriptional regulator of competence genes